MCSFSYFTFLKVTILSTFKTYYFWGSLQNDTKMNEETFKVRAYGYGELAQLYCSHVTKKSASAQLCRWINESETALPRLEILGYKSGIRLFTPAHVRVIIDEFGEP